MTYFKEVGEGDVAILCSQGVFKQTPLAEMDGMLFAKVGGGYVRLSDNGSTSQDKLRVIKLITDKPLFRESLGRLCLDQQGGKAVALGDGSRQRLQIAAD